VPEPTPLDPGSFLREHVAPRVERRIAQLRADAARIQRELDERLAAEATMELVLEGDGGGTWYLNLRGGEMRVEGVPHATPLVRVHQQRRDWEALARAQLAAGGGSGGPGVDLSRSRIERLRTITGTFELRLTGETERRTRVQFGPGEPSEARCVVTVAAADFARLQSGDLPPQVAFLQGLVKVQGDMAFAMQVATALIA
jgi:hypothetical protein